MYLCKAGVFKREVRVLARTKLGLCAVCRLQRPHMALNKWA